MSPSRSVAAKSELELLVRELASRGERQLPNEDELSRLLAVSRPTIRSALASLQHDGLIRRKHGVGTLINRHALKVRANIIVSRSYQEYLREAGYLATSRAAQLRTESCSADIAARLQISTGDPVCVVDRIFEADGVPAICSTDQVALSKVSAGFENVSAMDSVFSFVRTWADGFITHSVADLVPSVADQRISEILRIPMGMPVMCMETQHIDALDDPIAVTRAWMNSDYLKFSVIRDHES